MPPSQPNANAAKTTSASGQLPPTTASPMTFTRMQAQPEASASIADDLAELFSENIIAKIYRTASRTVGIPHAFPEHVPQAGHGAGAYSHREAEFWTCGFFPGSIYCVLERLVRFPHSVRLDKPLAAGPDAAAIAAQLRAIQAALQRRRRHADLQADEGNEEEALEALGKPSRDRLRTALAALAALWTEPLHAIAARTDTHDVGFIVMPSLRLDWELTGSRRSLDTILSAAAALATRFVPGARAIRSWDSRVQRNLVVEGVDDNLLVIIDSMCNLDLLYYAASQLSARGSPEAARLAEVATAHATTVLRTHLRPEETPAGKDEGVRADVKYAGPWYSTHHVANLDPHTGAVKRHFTAQGYSDTSQWARGQAWAILGYAQTYNWTRDPIFLDAACGLAEYFLHRLDAHPGPHGGAAVPSLSPSPAAAAAASSSHKGGRYVPPWDFDAPPDSSSSSFVPRDSSAGVIAANGMLILSQSLRAHSDTRLADRFLRAAVDIVRDTLLFALAPERAELLVVAGPGAGGCYYRHSRTEVADADPARPGFEAILKHGTANNNADALRRYADHGLVYADYYLLEFGNRLLRMGLV